MDILVRYPSRAEIPAAIRIYAVAVSLIGIARNGSAKQRISRENPSKSNDWGPSDKARSGQGCTSTMIPSAPSAAAALDIGGISVGRPVPCEGSAITGR